MKQYRTEEEQNASERMFDLLVDYMDANNRLLGVRRGTTDETALAIVEELEEYIREKRAELAQHAKEQDFPLHAKLWELLGRGESTRLERWQNPDERRSDT